MGIKVILTGATGMVGEGVLLECLAHSQIEEVLMVSRRSSPLRHAKLRECIVQDFFKLEKVEAQLTGYDACFYCAGISSVGMKEADYTRVTYDTPLHFAETLVRLNPGMIFGHISGGHTDSSEQGKVMWARVKGRAENALMRLPFKKVYNFRPGFMKPVPGQRNFNPVYRVLLVVLYPVFRVLLPGMVLTMREVAQAMINSVLKGYPKQVLEVADIRELAKNA
jgi:uncharacterized protein YbjT (DUF2867 family)